MQSHIKGLITPIILIAVLLGCPESSNSATQSTPLSSEGKAERNETFVNEGPQHDSHNALNPPIDCPLRKQGINPHDLKPFEDTQRYIDFLERGDRAIWQKPDEVIQELHLLGAEKIADVGAGSATLLSGSLRHCLRAKYTPSISSRRCCATSTTRP